MDVECLCCAPLEAMQGDARSERRIALASAIALHDATNGGEWEAQRGRLLRARAPRIYVDALLGTGFSGVLKPDAARAIAIVNELRAATGSLTVAVDLPSGLDCDTGARADPTITADVTATFVAEKRAFAAEGASPVLGRVVVLPIGIPRRLLERVRAGQVPS
jgi:NAD(P)H-hydrate epimerase